MTITRIGQLSGENQNSAVLVQVIGASLPAISATKAKTGSYSYRSQAGTYPTGLGFTTKAQLRAGVWMNHNGLAAAGASALVLGFFRTTNLADADYVVWDGNTGNLELYVENVLVASIAVATIGFNTVDNWNAHIGLTAKQHASAGFVTVYYNGIAVLTYSGAVSVTGYTAAVFGGKDGTTATGWASSAYFDDFYVDDTTSEANTAPAAHRYDVRFPSATGADAAFTGVSGANWANVDDAPPDDDTTYNKASSAALKDTFNFTNVTLPANHRIVSEIITVVARRSDAGTDSKLKLHAWDGATYASSAEKSLTLAYAEYFERMTTQPDASAWNQADGDAMQYGYESSGTF